MKFIVLIVLILSSIHSFANCTKNACSGVGKEVLLSIYPTGWSDGRVYIQGPSDRSNLDCTLEEGNYMTLMSTHPLFKEIYSTVLTAISTQKPLTIRIKNGSANCEVSYVRMFL